MSEIFISYASADRSSVEELHDRLRRDGFEVIYDKALDPGDRFPDWIVNTIGSARATLVLWSSASLRSDWVRHEASMAVSNGNYVPLTAPDFPASLIPQQQGQITARSWDDYSAVVRALEKRGCRRKMQHEEAIHSQLMAFGRTVPAHVLPMPHTKAGGTLVQWLRRRLITSHEDRTQNPLTSLFRTGRWAHHMPQKSTPFLNYDPNWLCERYAEESALPGLQPYSQLFNFAEIAVNKIEPRIRLEIEPGTFAIDKWGVPGDEVVEAGRAALIAAGKVSNEAGSVIRLSRAYVPDGTSDLVLRVQRATYGDQVRSNLISDYAHRCRDGEERSLRTMLAEEYGHSLPPLSDRRLANTLGVATILFYREDDIWMPALWPRASNLAVFEGGWHCSSSGAAEWWRDSDLPSFDNLIVGDMLREIDEELRISRDRILALVPVALCREFARLGKPQLFFAGLVDMSYEELVASANEAGLRAEARGQKREALSTKIYRYPRPVIKKLHALQTHRGKARHEAAYFDAAELFGKTGLTTECVTNLYYATSSLPYLKS